VSPDKRQPSTSDIEGELLRSGEITVEGRLPWSSNYTFLVKVSADGEEIRAVYKPGEGEQPLSDFPPDVYKREVAAYELSRLLGWPSTPRTVERETGPFGPGSLQRFVDDARFDEHYFTLVDDLGLHRQLREIAVFDLIANNTDRKAGHILQSSTGQLFAIDNGLCFHHLTKLRTVVWDFADTPVDDDLLQTLRELKSRISLASEAWLDEREVEAMDRRVDVLLHYGVFPRLVSQRQLPWPLI
jgi:hypothetical protein